jgi:hypothetical protein
MVTTAPDTSTEGAREARTGRVARLQSGPRGPAVPAFGQLLSRGQHKEHINTHFEACRTRFFAAAQQPAAAAAWSLSVDQLRSHLLRHGHKLAEGGAEGSAAAVATDVLGDRCANGADSGFSVHHSGSLLRACQHAVV